MAYTRNQQRPKVKKGIFSRPLTFVVLIVVVGLSVVAVLELTNTTYVFHTRKAVSSTIPSEVSTESAPDTSDTSETTPESLPPETTPPPPTEKTTAPPTSGQELLTPSGSFASNHRPSLKDSPDEESVCITTPGATCTIMFIKDGVTKTLESKKTNTDGIVIWNWDIKSAGFVTGVWQITAIATLDGQTKNSNDLQPLEVQP